MVLNRFLSGHMFHVDVALGSEVYKLQKIEKCKIRNVNVEHWKYR